MENAREKVDSFLTNVQLFYVFKFRKKYILRFILRNLKINAQLGIQENRYRILVQSICAIDFSLD